MILLLNKPYGVLCQFSGGGHTLKRYVPMAHVYPAGRLDADSEGLVVLTDDGALQHHITEPRHKMAKTYWAQVEGAITPAAIERLERGVRLADFTTRPAQARAVPSPVWLWERNPPIRRRKAIPTSWLRLTLYEGKNRQVRRMTAAVGYPTLRLIRTRVGPWSLAELPPGAWREATLPSKFGASTRPPIST